MREIMEITCIFLLSMNAIFSWCLFKKMNKCKKKFSRDIKNESQKIYEIFCRLSIDTKNENRMTKSEFKKLKILISHYFKGGS